MEHHFEQLKTTITSDGTHDEAFHTVTQQAMGIIKAFPGWLSSNPMSYLVIPMEPAHNITEAVDPPDRMQLSVDVRNCPRWLLKRLLTAEIANQSSADQQIELQSKMRQVNTADFEKLKEQVKAQKATIFELGEQLQAAQGDTMLAQHQAMQKQNQIVALEKIIQDYSDGTPIQAEQMRLDYEEQLSVAIEQLHEQYQQKAQKALEDKATEIQKENQAELSKKETELNKKSAELAKKEAELAKKDSEIEEMKGQLNKLKSIATHLRTDHINIKKKRTRLAW